MRIGARLTHLLAALGAIALIVLGAQVCELDVTPFTAAPTTAATPAREIGTGTTASVRPEVAAHIPAHVTGHVVGRSTARSSRSTIVTGLVAASDRSRTIAIAVAVGFTGLVASGGGLRQVSRSRAPPR